MGLKIGNRHLTTLITMKVIREFVLTDEYQTTKILHQCYIEKMKEHTHLNPVLIHNFLNTMHKLCEEGDVESIERQDMTMFGAKVVNKTLLFRRKQ